MKKKSTICFLLLLGLSHSLCAQDIPIKPLYKDAKATVEKRVDDLLSRMTLEEKILQLNQYFAGNNDNPNNIGTTGSIPPEIGSLIIYSYDPQKRNAVQRKAVEETRLGIPILFGYDVIHGFRTVYPIPLAQACSWNPELAKQSCAMAAKEAKLSGIDWTFSPMIDVARDGRWGRVAEGYGEDPYTNAVFTVAAVHGYQDSDPMKKYNLLSCLKHYVGYGASEGGRDYVYSEVSKQTLWDTYMPPYEAGVKAGAATLMSAFNDISGVPASANHYTLTKILKERWGHDGFVVSDWDAVKQLINQGIAADKKEAALKAFTAGVEMDMVDKCYKENLVELVNEGKISIEKVNDAVKRVLRMKFKFGLFDNPYVEEMPEAERYLLPEYIKKAEQMAEESMVLLKNKNNILPLCATSKIAVIGPMAKDQYNLLGSWSAWGKDEDVVSLFDGLASEFGKENLFYADGCRFDGVDSTGFSEAKNIAKSADIILLCLGEKKGWSGENGSKSTLALPQIQEQLLLELKKTGKPVVLILSNGRPLELNRIEPACDAILEIWQPGVVGGNPVAGILSGRINPSGKLAITFPYSTGQIPIYYDMRPNARSFNKYKDIQNTPLYEFAYGLSYTTFEYGDLKASALKVKRGEKLVVEVPVKNTGKRDGVETVHWFISDPVCTISRPVKELKYFEKQLIKAGETKVYRFEIDLNRDFGYVDENGKRFLEKGDFNVLVKNKKITIQLVD